MNDIMSYQYPPPGTPPPPYHDYPIALHMAGMGMRSPDQPGRNGSPSLSFDLKRANSRPHIKTDQDSEDSNMASAPEKKGRKLNYHRAPAACVHCRRRKIRCEPAEPSQDNNKCVTCNKLGKDCKFESVNAGGPTQSRHPSMSRASASHRLASTSSSSSPAISGGHTIDIHAAQHHGAMTMPPIHQMGLSDSPGLKMESAISRYSEYGGQGLASSWMGPDSATSSSSRTKHGSWGTHYDTTPMTPNFPPYPNPHHPIHSHHHQQNSHAPPTPQQAWASTPTDAGWGGGSSSSSSAYPPPTSSSSFSPLTASSYVDRPSGNKTPATVVMPAAEMYPPVPTMDPHNHSHQGGSGGGGASSPPGSATPHHHQQAGGGTYGGGWHQQGYPPIKAESGGWYGAGSEGGGAHTQTGMPVTDGYYSQR